MTGRPWHLTAPALVAAVVAASASFVCAEVQAQEIKPLLDRMERLERDIRTLNIQLSRGAGAKSAAPAAASTQTATGALTPPPTGFSPAVARLGVRISDLEQDLRAATGSLEEMGFRINQISQRLDKLVSDVDYRLSALEARATAAVPAEPQVSSAPSPPGVQKVVPQAAGGFAQPEQSLGMVSADAVPAVSADQPLATAAPTPQTAAVAPPPAPAPTPAPAASVLPEGTPKERYVYAFGLLRQAQYDRAEIALKAFIEAHGGEPLASNARYWLGETFYVRAAYVQAAEVFLEGYQKDPQGPKAPDTLLKLGMSLAGLNKKREACAAFEKLKADFPKASSGIKNAVKRESKRIGCS